MTARFVIMGFGYLLALLALALFAIECRLRVRDQKRSALELKKSDKRIEDLTARNQFLDRQNRALFGRCVQPPVTRPRCITWPRKRARSGR